jgi:hypothetical protein
MRLIAFVLTALLVSSAIAVCHTVVIRPAAVIPRDTNAFLCVTESEYSPAGQYRQSLGTSHPLHSRQDMLRICNDALSNHHYFLRDIWRSRGVCLLDEQEVFPIYTLAKDANSAPHLVITSWSDAPPKEWSDKGYAPLSANFDLVADGPCPRADSPSYVSIPRSPEGVP